MGGPSPSERPEDMLQDSSIQLEKLPEETDRFLSKGTILVSPPLSEAERFDLSNKAAEADHRRSLRFKETESRIQRENDEHDQERFERRWMFLTAIVVIVVMVAACLAALYWASDAETKGWARNLLNTLVTGFLAFTIGRRQPRRKSSEG